MRCFRRTIWYATSLLLFGALSAYAQFSSGFQGTVTDVSGAAVPGAKIVITDTKQGISRTETSNDGGFFRIDNISASTYRIEVSNIGFQTWTLPSIAIEVGEIRTLTPSLQPGAVSATVSVSATQAALDLVTPTTGSVVSQVAVADTPLVGQAVYGLAALAPGVTGAPFTSGSNFNTGNIDINAAGQREESNTFMTDGAFIDAPSRGGTVSFAPNQEIVQSVQINTNEMDAGKGRNSGADMLIFTKSGTNAFHGTGDYYFLNDSLTARTEFQSVVPASKRQEGGFSFGGPIIRNRTFFYGSLDVLRSTAGTAYQAVVPTQDLLSYAKTQFPGTTATTILTGAPPQSFPTANILTAAQVLAKNPGLLGLPPNMSPNLDVIGTSNISYAIPRSGSQWSFRADQYIKQSDRIYVFADREVINTTSSNAYNALNALSSTTELFVNLGWTHTFNPHLVLESGGSFLRTNGYSHPNSLSNTPYVSTVGLQSYNNWGPGNYVQNTIGWREIATYTFKSHELKFGVYLDNEREADAQSGANNRPTYSFDNLLDFVQGDAYQAVSTPVNLKTLKAAGLQRITRSTYIEAYVQDNWRLTRRLSLNLGLQYNTLGPYLKYISPPLSVFTLGAGATREQQIGNGIIGAPPSGSQNILPNRTMDALNPRIGFSYDVFGNGMTALRGGFGLFSDRIPYLSFINVLTANPPFSYTPSFALNQGQTIPPFTLCSAAVGTEVDCPVYPPANVQFDSHGGIVGQRAAIGGYDSKIKMAQVENWTLSIQQQLQSNLVLDLNYSASAGHHLPVQTDANRFAGDIVENGTLTRLNPSFGTLNYINTEVNSIGHFFSAMATRRTAKGLTLQGVYTWGKALDPFSTDSSSTGGLPFTTAGGNSYGTQIIDANNFNAQRGRADFDIRQQFAANGVWTLPNPWSSGWKADVLGGWRLGGFLLLHTGLPFTVYTGASFKGGGDYNADGYQYDVPNAPSFGNHLPGQPRSAFLNGLFPASAFPKPALGQEGNLGRNTFDAPGYANTNLNVAKLFYTPFFRGERLNLEFRGEFFNVFNHPNLLTMDSNLTDSNFGRATAQQTARNIQLHLKAEF
jgi:Carboxypeptidase regulatory-like domain